MSLWVWPDLARGIPDEFRFTLGEGRTPLVRSRRIGPAAGLPHLYFKVESANPTGSYKDRFAARAVAALMLEGKQCCLATSSGNTGAALAAYCAVAGIPCEIAIVETAPTAKLAQMLAYGARLTRVRGFGTNPEITRATMEFLRERAAEPFVSLQISAYRYSPAGMAGVQSIAYELAEQLAGGPERVFSPSGGGGLTLAVARGFQHLVGEGRLSRVPRIECVQPDGNDTIAGPLRRGEGRARSIPCTTRISGLQVADVIDGDETLMACRASGGTGHLVTDEETWAVQARLAAEEAIFCEPASAVAVAGALRARAAGELDPHERIVCLITSSGFKDIPSVERMVASVSCPLVSLEEFRSTA
ncbi:MAG: pyridoxal-phosphate dependent enzyme [Armatimonadetes bacterium]|nr:pyridoxal-phosphate dependent enzyme [Armatimonadota bacterium]